MITKRRDSSAKLKTSLFSPAKKIKKEEDFAKDYVINQNIRKYKCKRIYFLHIFSI